MAEITPQRALTRYEDDIDAHSFEYKDERQKFYFLVQFTNETLAAVKDGVRRTPSYDVLISRLGKIDYGGGTAMRPVADVEEVKSNIVEYFKSHALGAADGYPVSVIFE